MPQPGSQQSNPAWIQCTNACQVNIWHRSDAKHIRLQAIWLWGFCSGLKKFRRLETSRTQLRHCNFILIASCRRRKRRYPFTWAQQHEESAWPSQPTSVLIAAIHIDALQVPRTRVMRARHASCGVLSSLAPTAACGWLGARPEPPPTG